MRTVIIFAVAATLLVSCNPIPNKSVFEELSTDELASAIKSAPEFAETYEGIRNLGTLISFSEIQRAKYKDVTYRRLYKYTNHWSDSTFWQPKNEKWGQEWDETFANDLAKVDERVAYWTNYKDKNSLSRFAQIKLSDFYITHYRYIGGVEDAYICFNITPLQGTIEQIKFKYSYSHKINGRRGQKTHNCIYSTPISNTKEGMWEIDYLEKTDFDGMTVSKFLQKYDLDIEITDVRKDGKNYSLEDLNIPEAISNFWKEDTPETRDAVAVLINPQYVNRVKYIENKKDDEMKKYDQLCYDFWEDCIKRNISDTLRNIFD